MFVVRLVVYTKSWGRKRTILLSLTLLIIHDYDALHAVLLYHLLFIGCWSVIAGFLALSIFVGRWATNGRVVVCFVLREGTVR